MIITLSLGPLETNCYLYGSEGEAMVVDAAGDPDTILEAAKEQGLTIRYLVSTHGHFDHIGGLAALAEATGAPVLIHRDDLALLLGGGLVPQGTPADQVPPDLPAWLAEPVTLPRPPQTVTHGDQIRVGQATFQVIHTPGHTPGGICLYNPEEEVLFSGDTLFRLGVGRADLPGGHGRTLLQSIKQQLFVLPDTTRVYPGHGPSTLIGLEKARNPFVRPQP
ncbi:MAG: MBL fold metallo-hydrolase [Anaerolineae bacterium]|jgi:glyoxylase-like metal-dependent hydrolase (beta-lactamase superfamily II)